MSDAESACRIRERASLLPTRFAGPAGDPPSAEALAHRAIEEARSASSVDAEALAARAATVGASEPEEAARLLTLASIATRGQGRARLAVELCHRAAQHDPATPGLQRAWGLALLAWGDADGARGHLERWCEEAPESIEALLWTLEAAGSRPLSETGPLIERLAERLQGTQGTARPRLERPRVILVEGASADAELLVTILGRRNVETLRVDPEKGTPGDGPAGGADLVVMPLPLELGAAAVEIARRCVSLGLAAVPVLGVVRLGRALPDLHPLRRLGVVGVVDQRATAEHLAFRIAQELRMPGAARHGVRVPVDFPVQLLAEGRVTLERAENLSATGIRVCSSRGLDPNTDVELRFRLGSVELALEGSVVHCSPSGAGAELHSLGVFFPSLTTRERELLEREVDRVLTNRSE